MYKTRKQVLDQIAREPDFLEFYHQGMFCQVLRNRLGHFCGYVLAPGTLVTYNLEDTEGVHGCISFDSNRDGRRWIGFDCSHFCDYVPHAPYERDNFSQYKDFVFAVKETQRLAELVSSLS